METQYQLQKQAEQPVVVIRMHTPAEKLPQVLGPAFMRLEQHLTRAGQPPSGPPFVAYHNLDMQNLDIEIGFPVAVAVPDGEDVKCSLIPASDMVSHLFVGAYHEMEPAYAELNAFIQAQGREPTSVAYEYYLTEPDVQPSQTLIVLPLKPQR